jgi:RHH-type rel operon transcriptional repressor/antitoxin RelB
MSDGTSVVRISRVLDKRLTELAEKTGRRKSYYASKAIAEYLEDREDYLLSVAAYEESKGKRRYTLDDVEKRLGMARGSHAPRREGAAKARRGRSAARAKVSEG